MTLQPSVTANGAASRIAEVPNIRTKKLGGIAIVGLGYWGPNWARNLYQMQCAKRLVCCDFSRQRLEHIKALYPAVEMTDQLDQVLARSRKSRR